MTVSLRLSAEEANLMKRYAQMNGMTVSELVRKCVFDRIEEEHELKAYQEALKEFQQDSTTYTLDEVEEELGLR